jgi:hypothetical protein
MSDAPQSVPGSSMTRDEIDAAIERNARIAEDKRQSKLIDIIDEIARVRDLINPAWMAANGLPIEQATPLTTLLHLITDKLTAAKDALNEWRGAPAEDESGEDEH